MKSRILGLLVAVGVMAGCASPPNVLKVTRTGGDALPRVAVSPTGQVDTAGVNIGDTVVFAPGSMRAVVPAPEVRITLFEPGSVTEEENKKSLSINRRDGAKIEVMRGRLLRGDFFQSHIAIDLSDRDPRRFDIDLVLVAFNRGEKAFRGDLTIYDLLPPELALQSIDQTAKYTDRRGVKSALSAIPLVNFVSMAMDNFSRSSEGVDMQREELGQVSRYTFRRLVLEPGEGVGMTMRLKYRPPSGEELNDLRQEARPAGPGALQ